MHFQINPIQKSGYQTSGKNDISKTKEEGKMKTWIKVGIGIFIIVLLYSIIMTIFHFRTTDEYVPLEDPVVIKALKKRDEKIERYEKEIHKIHTRNDSLETANESLLNEIEDIKKQKNIIIIDHSKERERIRNLNEIELESHINKKLLEFKKRL